MKAPENQTALLKAQEQGLRHAVSFAVELAQKAGASAEVAVTKVSGLSVSTRLQDIENVEFTNDGALGISVYLGQQKGNASTSDLSENAIKNTVEAALSIAKYTSPDDCTGLADEQLMAFDAPDLALYHPANIDVEKATELALRTEKSALEADKRIVNSNGASFNSHTGVKVYGNTYGMLQSYLSSRYSLSCSVIGGVEGALENDYEYTISREFDRLQSPTWVGETCARKVVSRLNPQKLNTCEVPVIFLNDVATSIISHLAASISGGSLYRKSSFLLDRLGTSVLPEWFNISERPHLFRMDIKTPQETRIISDGKTLWFYDPFVQQVTAQWVKDAVNNTPFVLLTSNDKSHWEQYSVMQQVDTFVLKPKSSKSNIKQFDIRVDANGVLRNFSTTEKDGQTNLYVLRNITNQTLSDSLFQFKPEKGVEVDDQRKK